MKKFLLVFSACALLVVSACKKDENTSKQENKVDNKSIVSIIFQQALYYDSGKKSTLDDTNPFSTTIDFLYENPEGGSVNLSGNWAGSIVTETGTGMPVRMTYTLNFTETFTNWAFTHNNQKFYMNTNPGLQITGHAEYEYSTHFFSNYYQKIAGTMVITNDDNYSQTNTFDLTITLSPQGNGGTVTGTIDGAAVSFSVP